MGGSRHNCLVLYTPPELLAETGFGQNWSDPAGQLLSLWPRCWLITEQLDSNASALGQDSRPKQGAGQGSWLHQK